jgi:cell division initiation protein
MDLTPVEITQRDFKRRFRGLDPVEVRSFLEGVADELQRLLKECALKDEYIQKLEAQLQAYQEQEDSLKKTLVAAQRLTEEMKESARKEAALILKETELKAENLLEHAHLMLAELQGEIGELKQRRGLFEAQLRAAITLHLDLLEAAREEETGS